MVFNSLTFVVFFACVLVLHNLPLSWTTKKINLLIASYIFYAAWNPPFIILLWVSTVVDWYAAQGLVKAKREAARHAWMLLSVVANLGMLAYFKYGQFMLDNFMALMASLGVAWQPAKYDIVLPVGISFYTFATMSYTLDVYLRRAAPARNLLDYALFVTFFPHLVAGPIMRPTELVPQFEQPRRTTGAQLRFGLALMTLGLFNKIVLADSFLSDIAERVYDADKIPGALDAWAATLAFSGQIFCDFAGYSTTAIGAALCLGFAMPDNFRFPYAAVGFSDFWRRWHVSLSSWLRDYLYVSLGGNRHGEWRTYRNLMLTMLIGGLWHGAAWTFVIWGGLHGLYLAGERFVREHLWPNNWRAPGFLRAGYMLLTLLLVTLAWIFFRSPDAPTALHVIAQMWPSEHGVALDAAQKLALCAFAGVVVVQWGMREREVKEFVGGLPAPALGAALGLLLAAIVLAPGDSHAFIYFQF